MLRPPYGAYLRGSARSRHARPCTLVSITTGLYFSPPGQLSRSMSSCAHVSTEPSRLGPAEMGVGSEPDGGHGAY
eukprot:3837820-Prymnesium_polylepis.1